MSEIHQNKLDISDQEISCPFGSNVSINVIVFGAQAIRIVTLFAWKQTAKTLFYRNQAVLINKRVSIKWVESVRD